MAAIFFPAAPTRHSLVHVASGWHGRSVWMPLQEVLAPLKRRLPTPNAGEGVFRVPLMSTFCLLQRCHRLTDRSLTRGLWEWFLDAPKASDGRGCRDI